MIVNWINFWSSRSKSFKYELKWNEIFISRPCIKEVAGLTFLILGFIFHHIFSPKVGNGLIQDLRGEFREN